MQDDYETGYYADAYPGLIIRLMFHRKLHYHLLQTYCPSAVYLTISWLALFLPSDFLAERLAMVMTIMLTLTAMFASERQGVPRVAYITYLDIWMVGEYSNWLTPGCLNPNISLAVCILFVFAELVEFSIVNYLMKCPDKKKVVERIEIGFKICLPVAFFVFNAIYWTPIMMHYHGMN